VSTAQAQPQGSTGPMTNGEQPPYLLVALKLRCTAASLPWWRWWLRHRMRHDANIIAEHAHAIGQRIDYRTGQPIGGGHGGQPTRRS
jgi:hypothetical protein